MKNSNKKLLKIGTYSVVLSAIVLAVIIVVNLFVSQLPSSFLRPDLTTQGYYTVSKDSKKVIKDMDGNVDIYYIVTEGSEDTTIKALLENYNDLSDKITLKTVDPVANPNFTAEYTNAQLSGNSIIVVSDKRSTYVDGADFYKFEIDQDPGKFYSASEFQSMYQYYSYYGQSLEFTQYFFGENEITGAIDFVTQDNIPVMYELSGHGETSIADTQFGGIIEDENIDLKSLTLVTGDSASVPNDAAAILIDAPTTDITETEKDALIKYLDNGGKVILLTRYDFATKEAVPNLAEVCAHMGLEAVDGIVADSDADHYYTYQYYCLPTITGNGYTSLLDSKDYYVFMPACHGIQDTLLTDDCETYSLLETSEDAYIFTEETAEDPDGAEKDTFSLGYQSILTESGGSLIWFASPNIVDDQFVNYGNANLFIAGIQSIADKTTSVSIIGKPIVNDYLAITENNMTTWTVVLSIIAIAVLTGGIIVWAVRRRK